MRARLKKLLKAIQKEDAALKREGLESLNEQQLKDVSYFYYASLFICNSLISWCGIFIGLAYHTLFLLLKYPPKSSQIY